MARRVNTNFVIGLGAVLAVGTAGTFVLMRTNILQTRDPVKLTAMGEASEKKGDLNSAAQYYARAADSAGRAHAPNAAQLWEHAANTALALSKRESTGVNSEKDYQTARGWWNNALLQDPKYLPVLERILDDSHDMAEFYRGPAFWTSVQDAANKVLAAKPDYVNGYTYRGEARLELLSGVTVTGMQETLLKGAEEDANKALTLDPESDNATALAGRVGLSRVLMDHARGDEKTATAEREGAIKLLKDYLARHEGAPQSSTTLAQALLLGGDRAGAVTALETAAAKTPGDLQLAGMLATLSAPQDPAKAEAVLKALVGASAEKMLAYSRLAQFYEGQGRSEDAVEAWKGLLANPLTGGGLAAVKSGEMEASALASISWDYMDVAERAGISTPAGKSAMNDAVSYSDKLRSSRQASGAQDLLDGRVQLMKLNLPQAIGLLVRAESRFTVPDQNYWFKTKMLLTTAYEQQQDWGLALKTVNDVVTSFPNIVGGHLRKGEVLLRYGRYNEALAEVEPLTKEQVPDAIRSSAQGIKAIAYSKLGMQGQSTDVLDAMATPEAMTQIARNRLDQGDAQGAVEQVDAVLAKYPDNLDALYVGVLSATQANQKDKAADYVARALKKAPDNTQFKLLDAAVRDTGADLAAAQEKVLLAITDPVIRQISLAQLYGRQGDMKKQYEAMQGAAKAVDAAGEAAPRGAMNEVVDQLFVLSIQLARAATEKTEQDQYWGQAEKYVQQAETLNLDGVKGQMYRGRLQLAKGGELTAAAVGTLEQAVSARQDTSMGHTFLGEAYALQKPPRLDAALDQFRTAIQQKPDNLSALRAAIALLVDKGDPTAMKEAETYYKQGLQFFPRDKMLATMGDIVGEPADAIRTREGIRAKDPGNEENVKRLAALYGRQGDPQKAIDVLRPTYDKNPDVRTADFLAKMYRDTQQPGEALKLYDPYVGSADAGVKFTGLIDQGEMYRTMGRGDDAVKTFEAAMSIEPKGTDEAERRLADYSFDTGNMARAETLYQRIHDGSSGADVRVTYRLAETLIREGKFAAADALLSHDVLAQKPDDAKALVLRAVGLLSQNKGPEAAKVLKSVLSHEPTNSDALFYHASTLLALNQDLEEAARDLLAVRDNASVSIEAQLNSRLLLAHVYKQSRRYTEAAGAYEEAIGKFKDVAGIRVEYGNYLLWVLGVEKKLAPGDNGPTAFNVRSVKAQQRLDALLANSEQAYPKASAWQVLEGREASVLGDTAKAREKLAAAFAASEGDPATASIYLDALLNEQAYDEVVKLTTKLLADKPNVADYYVKRGTAYAALKKTPEAKDDFDRAIGLLVDDSDGELAAAEQASGSLTTPVAIEMLKTRAAAHPTESGTRMVLAAELLSAGRGKEADPLLTDLLADPHTGAGIRSQARRAIGLAKYQEKDFEGAMKAYKDVLAANPNDAETLNNLAFMLSEDMHKPNDALAYAQRAVDALSEGGPEGLVLSQGSVLDTYGWVKFRAGDKEGAISDLRKATQMEALPMAYLHLARVYKDIGRTDEAKKTADEGIRVATGSNDPALADLQGLRKELGS